MTGLSAGRSDSRLKLSTKLGEAQVAGAGDVNGARRRSGPGARQLPTANSTALFVAYTVPSEPTIVAV